MPVVVPFLKSTETVNAVPFGSSLFTYIGGSSSASSRSPGTCEPVKHAFGCERMLQIQHSDAFWLIRTEQQITPDE